MAPAAAFFILVGSVAEAQLGMFSKEQREAITAERTGERFEDGRPKVAASTLELMEEVTAEEAWGVLRKAGYTLQFEGGWKEINAGAPGRRLVGRVVTAVVDGSVRDLSGILEIEGFMGYVRDFDPSAIADVMITGINVPIRIGEVTVLPGDVLLSDPEGLTFIPPHLAAEVAETSQNIRLRDEWGHTMLREGKYTPGQIDTKWSDEMTAEFEAWAAERRK